MDSGKWAHSPDHGQRCQVIETETVWGETTCRVWLPVSGSVARIPASRLTPRESACIGSPDDIAYVAAAARVADALTQDLSGPDREAGVLLAPIVSSVIPLPHQIRALETLVPDRGAFLSFIRERWPTFLDREAAREVPAVREDTEPYLPAAQGTACLRACLPPVPAGQAGRQAQADAGRGETDESSGRENRDWPLHPSAMARTRGPARPVRR